MCWREEKFFIDSLLVGIHLIIDMIVVDWPGATGVEIPEWLDRQEDAVEDKPTVDKGV